MADLPVIDFIQERLSESDAQTGGQPLEIRKGTGFYDLFIKPQELMLQPLLTGMENTLIAQSIRRILAQPDPDAFDEELTDDAVGNFYVTRDAGGYARATIRVLYTEPVDREFPAFSAEFASDTLSFFNEEDVVITKAQVALQTEGSLYYIDFPVRSQVEGSEYNIDATAGVTFVNDAASVSASLLSAATGGLPRETNTAVLTRAKESIGVRDLETVKGINAILHEKFPSLREIRSIGMGDPEMMRDILYNAHVGGKTDVYLKTPALLSKSLDFIGLPFDSTRELPRNVHMQLTALSFADPLSELGTPNIVSPSVVVRSDTIETSAQFITASIPAVTGIDLTGQEWIKLKVDNGSFINIKVSGATISATQRFEVINAINSAVGILIASAYGVDQVLVKSPTIGAPSTLTLTTPIFPPRTDATLTLIPSAAGAGYVPSTTDGVFFGDAATVYIENVDYQVDYPNGKIRKLLGSAILSGDTVAQSPGSGLGIITLSSDLFSTPTIGGFALVQAGDILNITVSTGTPVGEYIVSEKINNQTLKILALSPTSGDAAVQYNIVSQQVVNIDYKYNPISIDIGPQVLLVDGLTRGIRPGREDYTITDMAFINVTSIEEIDPDTGDSLGIVLVPPGGFGEGGFGEGGFGSSTSGDFHVIVNKPTERFSVFEDSLIVFAQSFFGKSVRVTFNYAPEVASVHTLARADLERVTGADVLPKNFIPGFVSIDIGIRRDATNIETPDNATLATNVGTLVENTVAGAGLQASDISKLLEDAGVDSVRTPFTMTAKVLNPDGSTTIIESEDILMPPVVVLPKETDNFTTPRITHFYKGTITVSEVA